MEIHLDTNLNLIEMFNFFKKNNLSQRSIKDWEYNLLKDIVNNLPPRYSFLHNQINNDFFIDSTDNEILKDNWKRVILNQNLYKNYQNKKFNYVIKDVRVFDLINDSYTSVVRQHKNPNSRQTRR